jgi:hypothetical protein
LFTDNTRIVDRRYTEDAPPCRLRTGAIDRIEVAWPSARKEAIADVPANQIITIEEGKGIVARHPLSR